MNLLRLTAVSIIVTLSLACASRSFAAYNLEIPVEPWDEYRLQFRNYSKYLLASYDRAFVDDYEGAIHEVSKSIALLPEEGIGFAERSKYYRMLSNTALAEKDFKQGITLFNRAIERYRPRADKKNKAGASRKTAIADAVRLVATLRYQRGEAYFNFEQYQQASDDFAAACQWGNAAACSRIWDVKAIEKRGTQWVPLATRNYYNRRSAKRPSPSVVRVWVRREDPQPAPPDQLAESHVLQHFELNCSTREFRLIVALVIANDSQPMTLKLAESGYSKPITGSAPSKLMIAFCSQNQVQK